MYLQMRTHARVRTHTAHTHTSHCEIKSVLLVDAGFQQYLSSKICKYYSTGLFCQLNTHLQMQQLQGAAPLSSTASDCWDLSGHRTQTGRLCFLFQGYRTTLEGLETGSVCLWHPAIVLVTVLPLRTLYAWQPGSSPCFNHLTVTCQPQTCLLWLPLPHTPLTTLNPMRCLPRAVQRHLKF